MPINLKVGVTQGNRNITEEKISSVSPKLVGILSLEIFNRLGED